MDETNNKDTNDTSQKETKSFTSLKDAARKKNNDDIKKIKKDIEDLEIKKDDDSSLKDDNSSTEEETKSNIANKITDAIGGKGYIYIISVLLLLCFVALLLDKVTASYIDFIVWVIFTIDFVIRYIKTADKKKFFRTHLFDLIAIIPFFSFFRYFKALSLILFIFRSTRLGREYFYPAYLYLQQTQFGRIVNSFIVIFIILPIPLVWIEPEMNDYGDVLWWAIQTTTTVGYGDIVPVTAIGRLIGTVLMLVGVGLIGIISSYLTRFFLSEKRVHVRDIIHTVEDLSINEIHILESKLNDAKAELIHNEKNLIKKKHHLRKKKNEVTK